MAFVRSENPIWFMVDHVGLALNDEYYAFFMRNELPYLPAPVYQTSTGTPWSDPIEFQPSGTLPNNLYFDPSIIYRIEIRHGNTQFAELVWLIEDYVPGGSGTTPITNLSINTENIITNPQFNVLNFDSPLISTDALINVAPGWVLICDGSSGSVMLTRIEFSGADLIPTNPPYALQIEASGWTGITLRQRFNHNGALWTSEAAALNFTASATITSVITGKLVYSDATEATIISDSLTAAYFEHSGANTIAASANPDLPTAAFTDLKITWASPSTVRITSLQLIGQDVPTALNYEQIPLERQDDNLFHYYKDSLIKEPKASILTGWSFSLNPFQFITSALTTVASQTQYIADQTILHQLAASTVQTGKTGIRNTLQIKALNGVTNNKVALIQYIDPKTIMPYWGQILSSLARMRIFTTHATVLNVKMRLIWRTTLPSTIGAAEPIASWAGTDPVFAAGWTAIAPINDPAYTLLNAYDTAFGASAFPMFAYDGFITPDMSSNTMTLGIVVYTTSNMNASLGTEDSIEFDRISLIPNHFAVDSPPETFDDVLRQCQFYYEKSYDVGALPGALDNNGFITLEQGTAVGANPGMRLTSLAFEYSSVKRATLIAANITFYSPTSGLSGNVYGIRYSGAASVTSGDIAVANYANVQAGQKSATYASQSATVFLQTPGIVTNPWSTIDFHYTIDARLGII